MATAHRSCFYCTKQMALRTLVPYGMKQTAISYKCTHCQKEEVIICNTSQLSGIGEYIPYRTRWH